MTPDDYIKFMEAVANMRRLQKSYQKCADGTTRIAKKKAETKVDEMLQREIGQALKIQQALFK